jgi:hypothetical protein
MKPMAGEVDTAPQPSVTALVSGIVNDAQELIKQQAALMRAEIREELQKTKEAALLLAGGALVALPAIILVCFGVVYWLHWATTLDLWACYLLVGGGFCLASAGLIYAGVKKFQSFNLLPDRSIAALKENLPWRTSLR